MSTTMTTTTTIGQKADNYIAEKRDFVPRGIKGTSPAYTALFLALRAIDNVIQYGFLAHGLAAPLITLCGGTVIPQAAAIHTGLSIIDNLGLSPYRLSLLIMVLTTAIKHYWYVFSISEEAWHWQGAVVVGVFNIFWNTSNTLMFLNKATSSVAGGEVLNLRIIVGMAAFWIGIIAETYGEMQRKAFKQRSENKGKCFMGGLFSVTRHVNYSGYTLWRAGLALSFGGWIWSALVGAFFVWDFSSRAIPALDEYCSTRYKAQWDEYKRRTPYKLIPFLY